jgi:hypothetical protein
MSDSPAIDELVEILAGRPDAGDDDVVQALVAKGIPVLDAERLIAFVPSACGRAVLGAAGAEFSDEYIVQDFESGQEAQGRLVDEPVFAAAQAFIRAHGLSSTAVQRLAARSAEMNVAQQLRPGGPARGLRFVEAVLIRLPVDSVRSPLRVSRISKPKPWWRPW